MAKRYIDLSFDEKNFIDRYLSERKTPLRVNKETELIERIEDPVDREFVKWAHENSLHDAIISPDQRVTYGDNQVAKRIFEKNEKALIAAFGDNKKFIKRAFACWITTIKDEYDKSCNKEINVWNEHHSSIMAFSSLLEKINDRKNAELPESKQDKIDKIIIQYESKQTFEITGLPLHEFIDDFVFKIMTMDASNEFEPYKVEATVIASDSAYAKQLVDSRTKLFSPSNLTEITAAKIYIVLKSKGIRKRSPIISEILIAANLAPYTNNINLQINRGLELLYLLQSKEEKPPIN